MDVTKKFTNAYNDLIDFNELQVGSTSEDNVHALQALRVHLDHIWTHLRRCYEECRDYTPKEGETPVDLKKLRSTYRMAITVYKDTLGAINAEIDILNNKSSEQQDKTVLETPVHHSIKLPPCDTDIFYGCYKTWPTFRDLFSAIYIDGTRISKVEKLYHLKQKTAGEARDIIEHIPLTNDGFDLAWETLTDRYENTRMQVNEQLKTLFNLPSVIIDSSASLKSLQRSVTGCLETLKTLKIDIASWDPILVYLCSQKMPRPYLQDFEDTLSSSSEIPTWNDFNNFLTQRFKTLESVGNIQSTVSKPAQVPKDYQKSQKDKRIHSFQTNVGHKPQNNLALNKPKPQKTVEHKCQYCREPHLLRNCPKFLEKNTNDRIHLVKTTKTCYNCLLTDHGVSDCKSKFNCRICSLRHHTLLHKGSGMTTTTESQLNARPSSSAQALTMTIQSTQCIESNELTSLTLRDENKPCSQLEETLLFTALVEVESNGQRFEARAIIDSGSQSTFVSEKLKNRLRLPTKRNLVHVSGLNPAMMETSTQACIFTLRSRLNPDFKLDVWAPVLKTLAFNLPPRNVDIENYDDLDQPLADPRFNKSRPVDILIGLDISSNIFDLAVPMRSHGSLLTHKTVFGWTVGGPVERSTQSTRQVSLFNAVALDNLLTQFWEVEETPIETLRSKEDIYCENLYKTTTSRTASGRYMVDLPFRNDEELGRSRNIAMAQFLRMEKILEKKPDIKDLYDKTIIEYLDLGHMKKISGEDISNGPSYYLPHHAVIKPDRVTTKLRVVFNASSPSDNKKSLNDILYPGPILQQDLILQTLKWRFFKFVYNADITKMYRQILVNPSQTRYQRILFRTSPRGPIEDFELLTVTFGVNCAPFLAIRTLLQLAEDVKETHPLASQILQNNMYVDDVLAGGHTVEEAVTSMNQLNSALSSAGFDLRKWSSNNPLIISDLPPEKLLSDDCLHLSENLVTKTLGIKWNISSDSFSFPQPDITLKSTFTKREVLSIIARFFDPCGWLAPIIVVAKLIMQQIWLDKVGWDEGLRPLTSFAWENFLRSCPDIKHQKVPRWIHYTPSCKIGIHGFCDASEKAYAATLFIRLEENNDIQTHLLVAKTRVAPVKKISLPRLELCGAVLLAKLTSSIIPKLNLGKHDTYFWTDSTIVLAWLKKPPCVWNTFVGNRVSDIVEKVGTTDWGHVDSPDNPADVATRGCSSNDLQSHDLWSNCPATSFCQICEGKHNTLLHYATPIKAMSKPRQSRSVHRQQPLARSSSSTRSQHQASARSSSSIRQPQRSHETADRSPLRTQPSTSKAAQQVIFDDNRFKMSQQPPKSIPFAWSKVFVPTAQIKIALPQQKGMWHLCRVSINSHATVSRISVRLQSELHLETFEYRNTRFAKMVIAARLSRFNWQREIRAMLTNDLPRKLYDFPIDANPASDFPGDTLADSDPRCNAAVELEIGADLYKDIHRNGSLDTEVPGVIAQQTSLGYVFIGAIGQIW
ncbi:uncharacterized protein [Musca autumnalis]|uniref:uncharacterized protein n=1 Tax=Musca autumnalis TaxID=221902 RepID=UPI003CF32B4B